MFRPLASTPRRGTSILLVAVIMITMFAVVGVTFVFYAISEKKVSESGKVAAGYEGQPLSAPPDPHDTVNRVLATLLYDTDDDVLNGLRGHSLGRAMYGRDPLAPFNTTPWSGVGIFHENNPYGDRAFQPNYTLTIINGVPVLLDPEYTGQRPMAGTNLVTDPLQAYGTRNYIGKHVGYTYPDMNHFALAVVDPATGEVLVPSFHRPALGSLAPNSTMWTDPNSRLATLRPHPALHPNFPKVAMNPDGSFGYDVQNLPGNVGPQKPDSIWIDVNAPVRTLPNGKKVKACVALLIVPADGLFNLSAHGNVFGPGGAHYSHQGWGPWEVNFNPVVNPVTGARLLDDRERLALIGQNPTWTGRGMPRSRTGVDTRAFDPYAGSAYQFATYAPVAWGTLGAVLPSVTYPIGTNSLTGTPAFNNYQAANTAVQYHPAAFNPNDWPDRPTFTPNSRVFATGDMKRFLTRYAGTPDWHFQADSPNVLGPVGSPINPPILRGDGTTYPFQVAPIYNTQNRYRIDPAHSVRGLYTSRASELQRPKLVPNFPSRDGAAALSIPAGGVRPPALFSGPTYPQYPTPFPAPPGLGTVTDFGTFIDPTTGAPRPRWAHATAAIGSVDLNRPLTDYRTNTALPLSTTNPDPSTAQGQGQIAQATADRVALAEDIFKRLVVATGAAGYVNPVTGVLTLPQPDATTNGAPYTLTVLPIGASVPVTITYAKEQYDALRYLAQLAVNIVDNIDLDDISTVFLWNKNATGTANFADPKDVGHRVVFGVEKSRLLINEAYAEITNAPTDSIEGMLQGMNKQPLANNSLAHAKFWLELVNPSPALNGGPLGAGTVPLSAYQIQISRANRQTGNPPPGALPPQQQGDLASYLTNPSHPEYSLNVTGGFHPDYTPDATFTFPAPAAGVISLVAANNGTYRPNPDGASGGGLPEGGFVLVGPPVLTAAQVMAKEQHGGKLEEFNPDPAATSGAVPTVWNGKSFVQSPALDRATASTGMGYTFEMPNSNNNATTVLWGDEFRRHIVLLRRLANPYLPAGPNNPYITVDVWDNLAAADAVHRFVGDADDRKARSQTNMNGYDPVARRFSVGRVQPFAGHSAFVNRDDTDNANRKYNDYSFPISMVLEQSVDPAGVENADPANNDAMTNNKFHAPFNTFGRHNGISSTGPGGTPAGTGNATFAAGAPATLAGGETIMAPFDWMVHLDRPLVNAVELFVMRDCAPHRVTSEFVRASGTAPGVTYSTSYPPFLTVPGMSRALEFLAVRPFIQGVAHGGRAPSGINLNALQDKRILLGLLDPPAAPGPNGFDANYVERIWTDWMSTRGALANRALADGTSVQAMGPPAPTVHDVVGGTNQPFMPFGAPAADAGGTFAYSAGGYHLSGGTQQVDPTIMRRKGAAQPTQANVPHLYVGDPAPQPPAVPLPGYAQTEGVRKMYNNSTTVSHTFVVVMTIGYFDVEQEFPSPPAGWPANVPVPPRMGAEAYVMVPGDMRQKFVTVLDLTNMGLDPVANVAHDAATKGRPFYTALEATTYAPTDGSNPVLRVAYSSFVSGRLFVASDGEEVEIRPNDQLVLGYGTDRQIVTVASVAAGMVTIQPTVLAPDATGSLVAVPFRTVWGGTCLSNIRPGHPGPQSVFSYTDAKYKPVVPYLERMR